MSEAAPWRALEDDAVGRMPGADSSASSASAGAVGGNGAGAGARPGLMGAGRVAVAAVVGAVVIAAVAIWLVTSSGHGGVVVEGGGAAPGRSDAGGVGSIALGSPRPDVAHLIVDVQGAVVRAGIVELAPGSRVADAIAAAGGYGPRVAADRLSQVLNLAALVKDGDQIVVPSRDDPAAAPTTGTGSGGTGGGGSGPVDLNRATIAELDALPGVGPVTAAKIVAAREEQAFASVDDLRTRKILGAATFDKVKELVVVR
jgi:competence protein ComEA